VEGVFTPANNLKFRVQQKLRRDQKCRGKREALYGRGCSGDNAVISRGERPMQKGLGHYEGQEERVSPGWVDQARHIDVG